MFYDEIELALKSGKGGNGAVSFRREKYVPKGGPDGGDGGDGGRVVIVGEPQLTDLSHLASARELRAEDGQPGSSKKMDGRRGSDLKITVPLGTIIYRQGDSWRRLTEIIAPGQAFVCLKGGQGGQGNVHFATPSHQYPKYAQPGSSGSRAEFKLELRLIADVGIIGLPNAGKSTLISVISQAKPRIADYPFTTLSPVLGTAEIDHHRLIFADIPGLIVGSSLGKGLGDRFLRHIQRTRVLLHLIDSLEPDYVRSYLTVRSELEQFDAKLTVKPELVCLTKIDLLPADGRPEVERRLTALKGVIKSPPSKLFRPTAISAVLGTRVQELLRATANLAFALPESELARSKAVPDNSG